MVYIDSYNFSFQLYIKKSGKIDNLGNSIYIIFFYICGSSTKDLFGGNRERCEDYLRRNYDKKELRFLPNFLNIGKNIIPI
jgi:hypothetical protein